MLCYLEGQTYDEAARRIGCPVGTIRVRLSRARGQLRDRLTRGLRPSAIAAARGSGRPFFTGGAVTQMAPGWVEATVKAAVVVQSGRATVEVVSASALVLSQVVIRSMFMTKAKLAAVGLLSAGSWPRGPARSSVRRSGLRPGPSLQTATAKSETRPSRSRTS